MKQLFRPMIHMPEGWCEVEVKEGDIPAYIRAFHENEVIALPHGKFLVESFCLCRNNRVEVYLRPVPPTWEYTS